MTALIAFKLLLSFVLCFIPISIYDHLTIHSKFHQKIAVGLALLSGICIFSSAIALIWLAF